MADDGYCPPILDVGGKCIDEEEFLWERELFLVGEEGAVAARGRLSIFLWIASCWEWRRRYFWSANASSWDLCESGLPVMLAVGAYVFDSKLIR